MAYTPINWQTGDTITAEKMNKMDNGWGIQEGQLFSETVTTATGEGEPAPVGMLTYAEWLSAPSITVTFNGTDYTVQMIDNGDSAHIYGEIGAQGPSFANYPFCIISLSQGMNLLYTEISGTYTIVAIGGTLEVSDGFSNAVGKCVDIAAVPVRCVAGVTNLADISTSTSDGNLLYFWTDFYGCFFITKIDMPCQILPANESVEAYFNRNTGIFTVTEA